MNLTNFQKIKDMNIEELAEFLSNYEMKIYEEIGAILLDKEKYLEPTKEWLEMEVDE